jgi:pilus assembly protein Flp/PilA
MHIVACATVKRERPVAKLRVGAGCAPQPGFGGVFPMVKQMLEYYMARFRMNEEGATAVEYGVLIALIIAILVLVIGTIGQSLLSSFTKVDSAIK